MGAFLGEVSHLGHIVGSPLLFVSFSFPKRHLLAHQWAPEIVGGIWMDVQAVPCGQLYLFGMQLLGPGPWSYGASVACSEGHLHKKDGGEDSRGRMGEVWAEDRAEDRTEHRIKVRSGRKGGCGMEWMGQGGTRELVLAVKRQGLGVGVSSCSSTRGAPTVLEKNHAPGSQGGTCLACCLGLSIAPTCRSDTASGAGPQDRIHKHPASWWAQPSHLINDRNGNIRLENRETHQYHRPHSPPDSRFLGKGHPISGVLEPALILTRASWEVQEVYLTVV